VSRSYRYELGVGALLIGAAVVLAWMALQVGTFSNLGDRVVVTARLGHASGLQSGAVVAVAGIEVGTVTALSVDHDVAVVEIALDPSRADVRADALAQVRARSVLGEKFVELVPRSRDARLVRDGDVLAAGAEPTEIDELVSAIGPLVEAVDPVALELAVGALSDALRDDPERLSRMLANADTLLARGAEAAEEAPDLVREGRQTLTHARTTLDRVDRRLEQLGGVVTRVDAVLDDVEATTDDLPRISAEAEQALVEVRALLADVRSSKADVDRILQNFSDFDQREMVRLLREEGILVRLRPRQVVPDEEREQPWSPRGTTVP
jgi:phospholipid/cholesterol/gamma-HCH transport system substrate-binding protein